MQYLVGVFLFVLVALSAEERILSLGDHGSVRYIYQQDKLMQIDRLNIESEIIYSHSYHYNEDRALVSEDLVGGLGEVSYVGDTVKTPFGDEVCEYDKNHFLVKHMIDGVSYEYAYDSKGRMITEDNTPFSKRDYNGDTVYIGDNEYFYDEDHLLIKVSTPNHLIEYEYDPYGNRASRTIDGETEYFSYSGMNEIAILDNEGEIKQLRIPGLSIHPDVLRPIAIETQRGIFAPIHDSQWKIIKLINVATKEVTDLSSVDPFGRGIPEDIPTSWTYWGKNYDAEAGLVYFGKRYYSPLLREWLTPDPMKQSEDLYEYCLGNPFLYFDPDGQFSLTFLQIAWGAGVAITTPIWGPYAVATAAGVAAAYGLHKVCEHMEEKRHARWREKNYQPPNNWDCYRNKAGELQRQVEKGQAPDSVDRVDKGTGPHEKEHVHFKDDHALNYDGTWKHGGRRVSNREKAWLEGNGWRAPQ